VFVLILIGLPVVEVLAFVEVAHAIGWVAALALLLLTSVIGTRVLRAQSRAAIERVTGAVSQRREPAKTAIDGLLGFLGGVLVAIPGFVTDALGLLLLLPPTRRLAARRLSRHYAGRVMRFATTTASFASSGARRRPADVDSTAIEDDLDQLVR